MTCSQCSAPAYPPGSYCPQCAGALQPPLTPLEPLRGPTEPVFRLQGVFDARHQLHTLLPVFVFLALWSGLGLGALALWTLELAGAAPSAWIVVLTATALTALLVPAVGLHLTERTHRLSAFTFHHDRLLHGPPDRHGRRRVQSLDEIVHVRMQRDDLQERYGLGSIHVVVRPGEDQATRTLCMDDVEHPEAARDRIRAILRGRQRAPYRLVPGGPSPEPATLGADSRAG